MPAHQLPVPVKQCARRKEQAPRWQFRAQCGQDHPVSWQQVRPLDLPAQNGDLVAEGEKLEVPLGVPTAAQDGQLIASRSSI